MPFTGFTKKATDFLKDLAANNNKQWFEDNRGSYEMHLLKPLRQLANDLGATLIAIDKKIEIAPKVNKTISKIHRDIRFSNDKSPFRFDQWLSFRRPKQQWGIVPEFYFYFTPEEYQYGMGFYAATPQNMKLIREHIIRNPNRFNKIIELYENQDCFKLVGEDYKKIISNDLPEKFQPWYQKKNIAISCSKQMEQGFYDEKLVYALSDAFTFNAEFYKFIIESLS